MSVWWRGMTMAGAAQDQHALDQRRTFGDAVERMGRYKQLTCPEEIQQHVEGRDTAVEFVFTEAAESEPDLLIAVSLSFPRYTETEQTSVTYRINKVYLRNMGMLDEEDEGQDEDID